MIKDVVEKPNIKSAPSNYAVIGRYILPRKIFKILENQKPGKNGEIHITDAIKTLIDKKEKFIGHVFSGKYLDCGTMKGYIDSSIEISINDPGDTSKSTLVDLMLVTSCINQSILL